MLEVKNIIIGFGKAGRIIAKTASQKGETAVVIERDQEMYGGTCPNVGCVPSKTLIVAGEHGLDFKEAMARKIDVRGRLHNKTYHNTADEAHVTVLDGIASFVDANTVRVTNNGAEELVKAERIFINTGATPVIPAIKGVDSKNVITSKEALELTDKPEKLVIIGAGYVGLEFAGMYNNFGTEVTILDPHESFLPNEDLDLSTTIQADLESDGVKIVLGAGIEEIQDNAVVAGGKTYPADKVLLATGRKPNIDELQLEKAGIELADNGYIKVDDDLKTTASNVWAVGDVRGGGQFYYLSTDDYRIVADQLWGEGKRKLSDRKNVPTSVFIKPVLSRIGLDEKSAQAQGIDYRLFKMPAAAIVKSNVAADTKGLLKGLVDPKTDEILGVTLYMEDSHEVINLLTLAMNHHIPYTALREQIFTHPSMGEGLNDLFSAPNEVK